MTYVTVTLRGLFIATSLLHHGFGNQCQKLQTLACSSSIFMKYILLRIILPKELKGDRRPSHSKKSLSRSPYHWKLTASKWKKYSGDFLWSATRKNFSKIKNFRYRLPLSSHCPTGKKIFLNDSNARVDTQMVSPKYQGKLQEVLSSLLRP